jgi:hypothetical protein
MFHPFKPSRIVYNEADKKQLLKEGWTLTVATYSAVNVDAEIEELEAKLKDMKAMREKLFGEPEPIPEPESVPTPFVCEICGKAFAKPLYLSNHMRSHKNEPDSSGPTQSIAP